ncbi:hypothetical protein P8452_23590 [Trifolium repens]|nr:hypothetical protein P8452_23590 [Trifolium repens]
MEDLEKNSGNFVSKEEIRVLIKPLSKPQLVDLLSQLGSRYPSIAEEIQSFVNADPKQFQLHGEFEKGNLMLHRDTRKSAQGAERLPRKLEETIKVLGTAFSIEVARIDYRGLQGLGPYRGFHTAIIESNGMVVSITTFRLHRDIAEIAFVTTVQSRRREGLCGLLLQELEKHLLPL